MYVDPRTVRGLDHFLAAFTWNILVHVRASSLFLCTVCCIVINFHSKCIVNDLILLHKIIRACDTIKLRIIYMYVCIMVA